MEHYDVIIIGTGAGGGTLAHRLAPSGKRILLLERGGYLPREPENWSSREVFRKERYLDDELWYDKDGTPYKPHQQYFVGGNTKFYGAILFRLRERDFETVNHYGGVSPAWPISYEDLEPYYAEAERLYLVHSQAGEDPTEPRRSGPLPVSGGLARAADPAALRRLRAHRPPSVPPARRDRPERDRPRGRPLRAVRPLRRLPVPDRRQGRRPRALRAPRARRTQQPQADHPRQGRAPGDRRVRADGHEGPREPARHARDLQRRRRRRLLRGHQLGSAAALLGVRSASPWARQLVRRGGASLHGPHQLGRDRDLPDPEHDQVPEDARSQRLLLGRGGLRSPARPHPDAGQVRQGHPPRRRALVRPEPRARLHRQARDRLLDDQRGSPPSRPTASPSTAPATSTWPRRTTTSRRTSGCWPSSSA